MSVKQSLLDMGFSAEKVEKAVSACGENVEQAMEWCLAHADDPSFNASAEVPMETSTPEAKPKEGAEGEGESSQKEDGSKQEEEEEEVAKSIKCDDCGKLFKNSEEVEFHAVKSGHSAFSESKEEKRPLTDEEKKQKLKDLEEKLKQRRREKEEEEKREVVEREKKRIVMSRDILETKRRVEDQEIRRVAEERRREKKEDQMARQRVKEQIERDKLARKEMFSGGAKTPAPPAASQPPKPVSAPGQKKEYDCTRLQIRLPSGTPLVREFKSREALSAVRLWIGLNRPDRASDSFRLSTTFPRKVFSEEDMDKPLTVLGLVPSAVLVVMDQ